METLVFLTRRPCGRRCIAIQIAIVAELADAHGSGPCTGNGVGVRVPSMAPKNVLSSLWATSGSALHEGISGRTCKVPYPLRMKNPLSVTFQVGFLLLVLCGACTAQNVAITFDDLP